MMEYKDFKKPHAYKNINSSEYKYLNKSYSDYIYEYYSIIINYISNQIPTLY